MLDAFKENLLRPIIARVGTLLATILLTHGFDTQVVEPFVQAVTAVVLIGIDLLLSRYYRKLVAMKAISQLPLSATRGFGFDPKPYTPEYEDRAVAAFKPKDHL